MAKKWKCMNCKTEAEDIKGWKVGEYQQFDENDEMVDDFMTFFCSAKCKALWELEYIGGDDADIEQGGERQS